MLFRLLALASFCPLLLACDRPQAVCAAPHVTQAIVGGAADEQLLGLGQAERAALVYLRGTVSGEPALCSGVLIGARWLLTARHCLPIVLDPLHSIGNESGAFATAEQHFEHPELDLMLLRITTAPITVQPLPWADASDAPAPRSLVELAGYGVTRADAGGLDALHFLVAEATQRDDAGVLSVDGLGESGACDGDSGGPMLQRLSSGALGVVGILSSGSQSCTGNDAYTLTESADAWLRARVGAPALATSCAALSAQGRCFGERAVSCQGSRAVANDCAAPLACGFDVRANGFRCVQPKHDPCEGVSDLGECDGTDARRCERGQLVTEACGACGVDCVRSAETGRVGCGP